VAAATLMRRPRSGDRVDWACLAWAATYATYIVYQGRLFLHFLILIAPPLVLLASLGVEKLGAWIRSPKPSVRRSAFGLVAAAVICVLISASATIRLNALVLSQADTKERLVNSTEAWIRSETPDSATMFVWGGAVPGRGPVARRPSCQQLPDRGGQILDGRPDGGTSPEMAGFAAQDHRRGVVDDTVVPSCSFRARRRWA
jgi:hypothetical protein